MTYYLLANPNSGAGKGARTLEILLPYLEKNTIEYKLFATEKMGQEASLVKQILDEKKRGDQLIIIGGDGTISLVINELPADEAFGYIPAGSGNDFARSLKLSLNPIEAFEAARSQNIHEIYIMRYRSRGLNGYALNNIGIGLDATIVKSANKSKVKTLLNKLKLGSLSYILTVLHVLITKKPFSMSVSTDQDSVSKFDEIMRTDNAFLMTFTKHPYFGGGVKISPKASNLNQEIHLVEYDKHHLVRTFSLVPRVLKGTHLEHPLFMHKIKTNFAVVLKEEEPVQIDGEIYHLSANDELFISTEKRKIIY
ncbi:diacylglycerol/lipid kinase family protein [Lactococcus protaetiae]|uniref:Diacylglycerol kinase family lipid kinase n=1 Tax=Lactococcus protaetiae TaxID=2592653 RepID=A0A514ZB00_9LACT|nr:diacylglycerol kinase family protein [Lactococcus protaetiae]QDK71758.1 diacylglycerol kinase family lipid kinase [Lactococcus protaetiae]